MQTEARLVRSLPLPYMGSMALFLAAYGFLLFLAVDWVRGISGLDLAPRAALAGAGLATMYASYVQLKRLETTVSQYADLRSPTRWIMGGVIFFTIASLVIYRAIGGARAAEAGIVNVKQAWALTELPVTLKPLAIMGNYLVDTWLATLIGLLIGGAVLTFLPALLRRRLNDNSWRSHMLATVFALPNMFCSCCASPIAASMYRGGAALGPTLAFAVAAPSLNLVTLLLAVLILPPDLAMVRVAGALVIALPLTYAAAALTLRQAASQAPEVRRGAGPAAPTIWSTLAMWVTKPIAQACQFEVLEDGKAFVESPASLIERWLHLTWRIARVLVPLLVFGYLVAGVLSIGISAMGSSGNTVWAVALIALLSTLVMIPTAAEIPTALAFSGAGFPALAAVSLIALAPLSLPSLLVIGSSIGRAKPVLVLGGLVFVLALGVGMAYLAVA